MAASHSFSPPWQFYLAILLTHLFGECSARLGILHQDLHHNIILSSCTYASLARQTCQSNVTPNRPLRLSCRRITPTTSVANALTPDPAVEVGLNSKLRCCRHTTRGSWRCVGTGKPACANWQAFCCTRCALAVSDSLRHKHHQTQNLCSRVSSAPACHDEVQSEASIWC